MEGRQFFLSNIRGLERSEGGKGGVFFSENKKLSFATLRCYV